MKQRTHTLIIKVTFDKKCTRAHAAREARDCIHGEFYPTQRDDSEPGSFRVRSIRAVGRPEIVGSLKAVR